MDRKRTQEKQSSLKSLERVDILGVGVHALDMDGALERIEKAVTSHQKGYVCVTGVHGIMEAQSDSKLRNILNHSFLTTPDGMPTVWIGKLKRHFDMDRVYGPELMLEVCKLSAKKGYTHFLYGGNEGIAELLKANLESRFPGLKIVGHYTPPFRPLNPEEEKNLIEQVRALKPDFFWVGLSTPKQEKFMAQYLDRLDTKIMFGVGAAFDIHTGKIKDAPQWIKRSGLQWFHRLCQEPKRLGKRYLINNPKFVGLITLQLLGLKKFKELQN